MGVILHSGVQSVLLYVGFKVKVLQFAVLVLRRLGPLDLHRLTILAVEIIVIRSRLGVHIGLLGWHHLLITVYRLLLLVAWVTALVGGLELLRLHRLHGLLLRVALHLHWLPSVSTGTAS